MCISPPTHFISNHSLSNNYFDKLQNNAMKRNNKNVMANIAKSFQSMKRSSKFEKLSIKLTLLEKNFTIVNASIINTKNIGSSVLIPGENLPKKYLITGILRKILVQTAIKTYLVKKI